MHLVSTFTDRALAPHPTYAGRSQGYAQGALVDHTSGSVHTGLSIAQLGAGGTLSPHVHSSLGAAFCIIAFVFPRNASWLQADSAPCASA